MRYYDREDCAAEKVRSLNFTAEVKDGKLWGVAVCQVTADLTEEELSRSERLCRRTGLGRFWRRL